MSGMREEPEVQDAALDSLFGPFDFMESQLGSSEGRGDRMSESPPAPSDGRVVVKAEAFPVLDAASGGLDVLRDSPLPPKAKALAPPVPGSPADAVEPDPKRGRKGPRDRDDASPGDAGCSANVEKMERDHSTGSLGSLDCGGPDAQSKADRCRARNREHARQTRRRKKEFVEGLQVSVQALQRENGLMAARLRELDARDHDKAARADTVAAVLALRVASDAVWNPNRFKIPST